MLSNVDLERLRIEHADRERRLADSDIYSPLNKSARFTLQQRHRSTIALLRKLQLTPLKNRRILELGC